MTPKKILSFAIGPIGGAFLGLITLPLITWFFAQEDVGRLSMLQVTLSFGVLLFSLGLDQSYVREFHEREDKSALLKQAAAPGLVLLVLTVVALLSFGGLISELLFDVPSIHLSLLVAVALLANFTSRFLSLVLRMKERGLAYSMSQLLPKLLLVILVGLYVITEANKTLTNLVFAATVSFVAVAIVFAWNTREEWLNSVTAPFNLSEVIAMLRFGLPLILGGLAFWGLTALDKVFLRTLASYEELAIYSVSVSFAAAASIFKSVFSTVWAPTVYKWASSGEGLENIEKTTRFVLTIVVLIFCLAGLFSWGVTYVLPSAYDSVQWIVVSCLGFPLLYTLSETTVVGIGISRRSSYALFSALIAFGVNIAGNFWLIPFFGAKGAAVSTCFSFWVFLVLRTEFSIYLWRRIPRLMLYTYTSVAALLACIFTLYGEVLNHLMPLAWGALLLISFVSFKNEYRSAFNFLRTKKVRP